MLGAGSFDRHLWLLASLPSQDDDGETGEEAEEEGDKSESRFCDSEDVHHPVAMRYSEVYDGISEDNIVDWFCTGGLVQDKGFGFGQIKHAIETALILKGPADDEISPDSVEALLKRKAEGEGWGQIWQDFELIGKNKKTGTSDEDESDNSDDTESSGQGGPPDHAGPKDKTGPPEHAGPPSHAGPKKNKDKDK